jgi:hypothetical protein
MTTFLRHEEDTLQELLLETDSDKPGSSESDKDMDTNNDGHDGDCCCKWEPHSYLVKATGTLELWWCPTFPWRCQWIEVIRGTSCEQGFYTNYCLSPVLHESDSAEGGRD